VRNATKTISKSVIDHGSYRIIAQFLKNKQKQVILRNNTNVWVSSLAERKVPYYTKWTIQQLQGTRYLLVILTHSPAGKTQRDFQGQPHKRVAALSILNTQFSKYWGRSRSLLLSLSRRPSKSVCVRGLIVTAHPYGPHYSCRIVTLRHTSSARVKKICTSKYRPWHR